MIPDEYRTKWPEWDKYPAYRIPDWNPTLRDRGDRAIVTPDDFQNYPPASIALLQALNNRQAQPITWSEWRGKNG